MAHKAPPGAAWAPAPYEPADIAAVQALAKGEGTSDQQIRVLKWIVETVAGTYDQSFRPDSERDTAFAEGKRWVGNQIVKLSRVALSRIRGGDKFSEQG